MTTFWDKGFSFSGFTKLGVSTVGTDDDFTGTNGDYPNGNRWRMDDASGLFKINNNTMKFTGPADNNIYVSRMLSDYWFAGDFEVQLDYTKTTLTQPSASASYNPLFELIDVDATPVQLAYIARHFSSGGTNGFIAGGPSGTYDFVAAANTTGKLKIKRASGAITVWHYNGALTRFEWNGDINGRSLGSDASKVKIQVTYAQRANSNVVGYIDNVVVNSGTASW